MLDAEHLQHKQNGAESLLSGGYPQRFLLWSLAAQQLRWPSHDLCPSVPQRIDTDGHRTSYHRMYSPCLHSVAGCSYYGQQQQKGDRGQVRVTISDALNNPSTQARQALQLTDGCPNV